MSNTNKRHKASIELLWPGDGRTFINYWNYDNGDDVVCELKDGKLMLQKIDSSGKDSEEEITFQQFVQLVLIKS